MNYKLAWGYRPKSVDWQGEAWYRVMGDAGTRIREGDRHGWCKTTCSRYLPSGSHPKTPGELVENVKVCYNCNNDICQYSNTNNVVKIRHCGEYFVYYLKTTIKTDPLRYCTE